MNQAQQQARDRAVTLLADALGEDAPNVAGIVDAIIEASTPDPLTEHGRRVDGLLRDQHRGNLGRLKDGSGGDHPADV